MLDTLFSVSGALAMVGWAGLVLLPRNRVVVTVVARQIIPLLIAGIYAFLMATHLGSAPEGSGFGSLAEVSALFTVDGLLLAGWVHYLAFDLFVGSWEVEDAQSHGVPHLALIPCLAATFLAGPLGLALYLAVRTISGWLRGDEQPAAGTA
ncbi:MAG: ABA4-like family protein [Pseudomonadales bacterium]